MGQIVGGKRDRDVIAEDHADAELSHSPTELGAYGTRVGLNLELSTGEDVADNALELDVIVTLILTVKVAVLPSASAASLLSCQTILLRKTLPPGARPFSGFPRTPTPRAESLERAGKRITLGRRRT